MPSAPPGGSQRAAAVNARRRARTGLANLMGVHNMSHTHTHMYVMYYMLMNLHPHIYI